MTLRGEEPGPEEKTFLICDVLEILNCTYLILVVLEGHTVLINVLIVWKGGGGQQSVIQCFEIAILTSTISGEGVEVNTKV